ncbi:hypothetical protein ILUMI_06353 [Ignelater luminosus]|uniref:Cytochrome P450 n=1 Tax=Ignelater luminosus TaxID=2038154 RepID=A0A8K0GJ60_IGNLU|nr:hypothetical protein ILUMI_06353 [Ignelater luminosus]
MDESIKLRRERRLDRMDIIHLLMEAQKGRLNYDDQSDNIDSGFSAIDESDIIKKWKKKIDIKDDDIMGVGLGFFLAGYDTASNVMSYIAYELAANPDVQEKLFREVSSASREGDGKITYETLLGMKYLDMVVSETLRKWPPGYHMDRECRIPFTIEPEREHEKPLHIEKGTQCLITVLGIHRDPQYYPNPEKFDPERFNNENKRNIKPYTYMPFSVGPRSCMGTRFALLEMKLVIAEIIRAFEIVISDKMQFPLNIKKVGFSHYPAGGMWLCLKPREVAA